MPGLFIDRATPGDVAALSALQRACFSHPWSARQIADEIAAGEPGAVLVARSAARGAGVSIRAACAYRVVADEMQLLDVSVEPPWRGLGLARRLVSLALRRAARAGARCAYLEVRAGNAPALSLYASLGFVACGRRSGYYSEPVEDACLLVRRDLEAVS